MIAPLGVPARPAEDPDRTRNVPQKPIKLQLFPVYHIKVQGLIVQQQK